MYPLIHPINIGSIRLENNLALAPMAGTTESVFRGICRGQGAGLVVTELVSARGICYDQDLKRSWRYLYFDQREKPVAVQLFGSEPEDFYRAVNILSEHPVLGKWDIIDINMGCPVAKVVRQGEGAALMRTPELAAAIIRSCVRAASGRPVTVKFRKGWDDNSINAVDFARVCEDAGAFALTVHGRTRIQMYSGRADWQIIGQVKQAVKIPVYGNGDIDSASSFEKMLLQTGADGAMIGRAAQGSPWLFRQIANELSGSGGSGSYPSTADKIKLITEHMTGLVDLLGEYTAVREMRQHLIYYIKGTPQSSELKRKAAAVKSRAEIISVLEDWRILCSKTCENS